MIPTTPPDEKTDNLLISNRQLIEEPPPYAAQVLPAPVDALPPPEDETIDYGVLAVSMQQRQNAGEAEQPLVERRVEEMPEGSGGPRVCTDYACQNPRDLPLVSDCSIDDYGVVGQTACGAEKNYDEQEEDELDEETSFISWDPKTGKLMLPHGDSALSGEFNWAPQEVEFKVGGSQAHKGEALAADGSSRVLLESVFVRQSSEEEAEAQAKLDTAVETERKLDNFLSGWDLVVAMD